MNWETRNVHSCVQRADDLILLQVLTALFNSFILPRSDQALLPGIEAKKRENVEVPTILIQDVAIMNLRDN